MSEMMIEHAGSRWERLPLADADVRYEPCWLVREEADALLQRLQDEIPWERHRLRMFGREVDAPRLSCWIGDPGATYMYSRSRFEPHPWTPSLLSVRARVEEACQARFNSVLANLYRNGDDAMGWHSDDEPELGSEPLIASLSLGAERTFRFRAKSGGEAVAVELGHGSLLRMAGATQRLYKHELPARARIAAPRINLTFRLIGA